MIRPALPWWRMERSSCAGTPASWTTWWRWSPGDPLHGKVGIGHTRWATHGEPNARNAHPHIGRTGEVVVVHNGIVENFLELREELAAEGVIFNSETDTETIVHLVERYLSIGLDLVEAVRRTLGQLKGAHGVVVMSVPGAG